MNRLADISIFESLGSSSLVVFNETVEQMRKRFGERNRLHKNLEQAKSALGKAKSASRRRLVALLLSGILGGSALGSLGTEAAVSNYPNILDRLPAPVSRTLEKQHNLYNRILKRYDKDQVDADTSFIEDDNAKKYREIEDEKIQTEANYDALGQAFAELEKKLSDTQAELLRANELLAAEREKNSGNVSEINRLNGSINKLSKEMEALQIAKDNLWQMYRGKDSVPEYGPTSGASFKKALAKQLQIPRNFLKHLGNYLGSDAAATPHY